MKDIEQEYKQLKIKYKKKYDKVLELNRKIDQGEMRDYKIGIESCKRDALFDVLRQLTAHVDVSFWKIEFMFHGKKYTMDKVQAYGARWLEEAIIINEFALERGYCVYAHEIEIISATKLY